MRIGRKDADLRHRLSIVAAGRPNILALQRVSRETPLQIAC